jgi:hypothetical protein
MNSDDSSWLWIGNAGETVSSLESRRSSSNATINNSGTHSANAVYSQYIPLVAGEYYPLLAYYGENYDYYWWNNNEIFQIQSRPYGYNWTFYGSYYQDDSVLIGGGQPHPQEREGVFDTAVVNGVTISGVQSSYT